MKRIIFFCTLFLSLSITVKAQHTLQFNRAILVSSQQTVPDSFAWKIVAVLPSSGPIGNYTGYTSLPSVSAFAISINSNPVYFASVNDGWESDYNFSYTNPSEVENLSIWLPAGTSLAASTNIQYISVIEFKVN